MNKAAVKTLDKRELSPDYTDFYNCIVPVCYAIIQTIPTREKKLTIKIEIK